MTRKILSVLLTTAGVMSVVVSGTANADPHTYTDGEKRFSQWTQQRFPDAGGDQMMIPLGHETCTLAHNRRPKSDAIALWKKRFKDWKVKGHHTDRQFNAAVNTSLKYLCPVEDQYVNWTSK